jgi:hypothetical protein
LALLFVAACACVAPTFSGPTQAAGPQAAATPVLQVTAAGGAAQLTADSATLGDLVYQGLDTASTPGGDVQTLKFTMSSVLFNGLALQGPCESPGPAGTSVRSNTLASTAAAPSPGGMTFWATSVTATTSAGTTTWDLANPPSNPTDPAALPPIALGTLPVTSLVVQLVQATTPAFDIPSSGSAAGALRQFAEFCTP